MENDRRVGSSRLLNRDRHKLAKELKQCLTAANSHRTYRGTGQPGRRN